MSLHATQPRREFVLAYGQPNSGKSSTWVDIAHWFAQTSSPNHIYVGSTDCQWDAMRSPEIEPYVTVTELDQTDYIGWINWIRGLRAEGVSKDDVVVFDKVSDLWEAAQDHYFAKRGQDILADVKMAHEQSMETRGKEGESMGGAYGSHWNIIKSYHAQVYQPFCKLPCHKILCADAKAVPAASDDYEELKATWKVGFMAGGEKNVPKMIPTWLYCQETSAGHRYTTIRDKTQQHQEDRTLLKGQVVENGFVLDYLLPVCGWEL